MSAAGSIAAAGELRAHGLSYSAGQRLILSGIECTLPGSAVTGLLGPNGAGKSSLLRLMAAILKPTAGQVSLAGTDLRSLKRKARAQHLAFVDQQVDADVPLSVADAVLTGRLPYRPAYAPETARDELIVQRSLAQVGLEGFGARRLDSLSGGERQRVHIARALAQETGVLLLDEPTNHLDLRAQAGVLHLLRQLARGGSTVVAALHDINLTAAACDHVIVLAGGRVVASGETASTLTPELIRSVYGVPAVRLDNPLTGRPVFAFGGSERP
ncbi:ABC transporter ATP-binding protein [Arthrobacter zhaoguopingii]|uniref:ABC transporter ATP-binding protein n=1 Tax=Arthrobacter zhaoguopingii TaxID=2681491 RepID=UPI00135C986D|nr:ABC transporter ATP-binding protein [Arthrobacter zhaoguopingii]